MNIGSSPCGAAASVLPSKTNTILDYNGDGRADIAANILSGSYPSFCFASAVFVADDSGAYNATGWTTTDFAAAWQFADLNGDGLNDQIQSVSGNYIFKLNTSQGFTAGVNLGAASAMPGLQMADFNADGYADLIYSSNNSLVVRLYNSSLQNFDAAFTTYFPYRSIDQNVFADVDGDGHTDLLQITNSGGSNSVTLYRSADSGGVGSRITGVDNGLGNTTTITYKPLTDSSVYTKSGDANDAVKWPGAPVFDVAPSTYVVAGVAYSAPAANADNPGQVNYSATSSVSYRYSGLKLQASGRGSLGFASIRTTDAQSGVVTTITYRQDFPFIGQPLTTEVKSAANVVFKSSQSTPVATTLTGADGTKYYQLYVGTVTEQVKDPSTGAETSYVVSTTAAPDSWGNISSTISSAYSATDHINFLSRKQTASTYGSTAYEQQFGRLNSSTVTQMRAGASDVVRTSSFTYYGSGDGNLRGLLKTESVSVPDGTATPTTEYQYDSFGNKTRATTKVAGSSDRYSATTYDANGRYVVSSASAFYSGSAWADQITEQVMARNAYGQPTQVNGLNGLVTTFQYDVLGRETQRSDNTGAALTTAYSLGGMTGAQYRSITTASTGATATEYFDALGRSIAKTQVGFDGRTVSSETEYDNVGRVRRQSTPHYGGDTAYWSVNKYDEFGRLTEQRSPASAGATALTQITYSGLTTTATNALGQQKIEVRNALGESVQITDHLGGVVQYFYDAAGQLVQTTNTGVQSGATVNIYSYLTYDQLGRKIKMIDSSKGTWFYQYSAFGDLTDQYKVMSTGNYGGTLTQALADNAVLLQHTHMDYDRRGRVTARADYRETRPLDSVLEGSASWSYDTAANGIGQLLQESGGGLTRTYAYDSLGRPASTLHADGNGTYLLTASYDSVGRVLSTTDALGTGSGTQNSYNQFGYLQSVADLATGTILLQQQALDARGNVTTAILGNGATTVSTFDPGSGLLLTQTATTITGTVLQSLAYTWDVLGNQMSRRDQGVLNAGANTYKDIKQSFCYDGLNRLIKSHQNNLAGSCSLTAVQQDQEYDAFGGILRKTGVGTYSYSAAHPHHLSSTSDGVSYTYDNVGNMISDSSNRTLHYTVFDKPDVIAKLTNQVTFAYAPDRSYYKRVDSDGSNTTTTYQIGSVEKVVKPGGSYDMKRYIAGALWNHHFSSAGVQTGLDKQYTYKDALGSTVLITDQVGAVKQQLAFDAWGQRVNNTDWNTVLPASTFLPVSQQFTTRGFTGHDMLDAVGLIHMQGRIYDARLGRFVQADPIVQDASDLQAYNRYAYVRNNPLTLTDPTGFSWLSKTWKKVKKAVHSVTRTVGYAAARVHDFEQRWSGTSTLLRAIDPKIEQFAVAYGSKFCGPYAGLCAAAATYDIARAHGASINDAAKAGAIAGVSTWAFQSIDSYYGNSWTVGRVGWTATAGGITSAASGGSFKDGFLNAGIPALLTLGNYEMRQAMVAQSSLNSHNISGESEGFFGDFKKLAGARREVVEGFYKFCDSLMGGCQGAPVPGKEGVASSFFGMSYSPGSVPDIINESFAGPHDWFRNLTGSYTAEGNSITVTGFAKVWDDVKNYTLVLPAAPLAIAGLIETKLNANVALTQRL